MVDPFWKSDHLNALRMIQHSTTLLFDGPTKHHSFLVTGAVARRPLVKLLFQRHHGWANGDVQSRVKRRHSLFDRLHPAPTTAASGEDCRRAIQAHHTWKSKRPWHTRNRKDLPFVTGTRVQETDRFALTAWRHKSSES